MDRYPVTIYLGAAILGKSGRRDDHDGCGGGARAKSQRCCTVCGRGRRDRGTAGGGEGGGAEEARKDEAALNWRERRSVRVARRTWPTPVSAHALRTPRKGLGAKIVFAMRHVARYGAG